MRYYLALLFAVTIMVIPWYVSNFPIQTSHFLSEIEKVANQVASIILAHDPKTVEEIQSRYNSSESRRTIAKKVRILLVPGHEPNFGGAEYGSLKEREMTVELTNKLREYISENERYEVFVSRNASDWDSTFSQYFKNNAEEISLWQKAHKDEISSMARLGEYKRVTPSVFHNSAPNDVAMRLYGIDKWSNENDIDIVVHVHFNDYPRRNHRVPGEYSGFSIYVPEKQYYNSPTTFALAETIFKRLEKYNAVSNLPGEKNGIVEDQDLIAVGSYNSVNAASMLIEYGYIYEPQFVKEEVRTKAIDDLAFQTYLGIQDFFDAEEHVKSNTQFGSSVVPHFWEKDVSGNMEATDVFAMQTALVADGVYPPTNRSKNDCPRSGSIGPCTKAALELFQNKYDIKGEKGKVGPKTIEILNSVYGIQPM